MHFFDPITHTSVLNNYTVMMLLTSVTVSVFSFLLLISLFLREVITVFLGLLRYSGVSVLGWSLWVRMFSRVCCICLLPPRASIIGACVSLLISRP